MHHYFLIRSGIEGLNFKLIFENETTKGKIEVSVPLMGAFENPEKRLDEESIRLLAANLQRTFNNTLDTRTQGSGDLGGLGWGESGGEGTLGGLAT